MSTNNNPFQAIEVIPVNTTTAIEQLSTKSEIHLSPSPITIQVASFIGDKPHFSRNEETRKIEIQEFKRDLYNCLSSSHLQQLKPGSKGNVSLTSVAIAETIATSLQMYTLDNYELNVQLAQNLLNMILCLLVNDYHKQGVKLVFQKQEGNVTYEVTGPRFFISLLHGKTAIELRSIYQAFGLANAIPKNLLNGRTQGFNSNYQIPTKIDLTQYGGKQKQEKTPIVIATEIPVEEIPVVIPTETPVEETPTETPVEETPTETLVEQIQKNCSGNRLYTLSLNEDGLFEVNFIPQSQYDGNSPVVHAQNKKMVVQAIMALN